MALHDFRRTETPEKSLGRRLVTVRTFLVATVIVIPVGVLIFVPRIIVAARWYSSVGYTEREGEVRHGGRTNHCRFGGCANAVLFCTLEQPTDSDN